MHTCWLPCLRITGKHSSNVAALNASHITSATLCPLLLLITGTELWEGPKQPRRSHVPVQLTLTWVKSMSPAPPLHSTPSLTLSSCLWILPPPLFPLFKVANELWIALIHILRRVQRHLSSFGTSQQLASFFSQRQSSQSQGKPRSLYCVSLLLALSK